MICIHLKMIISSLFVDFLMAVTLAVEHENDNKFAFVWFIEVSYVRRRLTGL